MNDKPCPCWNPGSMFDHGGHCCFDDWPDEVRPGDVPPCGHAVVEAYAPDLQDGVRAKLAERAA